MSPVHFTNASGPGLARNRQFPGSIALLEALDNSMLIGVASATGRTEGRMAIWGSRVHGGDVPGRSVIVDGRFGPVESETA